MLTETQDRDAIVSNAIEIASAPVRAAYIAGACGNDAALKRQVEEQVAAHFAAVPSFPHSGRNREQAGENHAQTHQVEGTQTRDIQRNSDKDLLEAKKMGQKKPSGMVTIWALLLLPVMVGGAGVTAWKLRADDAGQATLQQVREELDQTRKSEAEVKKKLEQVQEARQALEREREEALTGEKKARTSAEDTKEVLSFLRDNVFLAPGRPTSWSREGLGKDVTLRKAVELAAAKLAGAYKDRPLVEAAIREILGASYLDLGDAEQAVKQYKRAFALRESVLGPADPDTCDCRNKLAVAYRDAGHHDEASRLYDLNDPSDKGPEAMRSRTPIRGQNPASQNATPGAAPKGTGPKGQGS